MTMVYVNILNKAMTMVYVKYLKQSNGNGIGEIS
jgi:hypothetical protein